MFLLDTDTVIFALRGYPPLEEQLRLHRDDPMKLSAATMLELYDGAHKSRDPIANLARVRRLESGFEVLPVGPESFDGFGRLKASLETAGARLDDFDLIIAACALAYNLTLVTNNEKHFRRIGGLRIENWIRPSP